MKKRNKSNLKKQQSGFTLIEMLISSLILLAVIMISFTLYSRSNRISVDQQMSSEVQNDVRSALFTLERDIRAAGVGLIPEIAGYFIEGIDGFGPGPELSDSLKIMGNFDDPLSLSIEKYQGGVGGGSSTASLIKWDLENAPYPCPEYYEDKTYMLVSVQCPGCFSFRFIGDGSVHGCGSGNAHVNFQPGNSSINPPGGLLDTGCTADCWDGAVITLAKVFQYWLDSTGNPADYSTLNLAIGDKGYLGIPNTLYFTTFNDLGETVHTPLAMNIESLQFQYDGDLDDDGVLDGFKDWDNSTWTVNPSDDALTKEAKLESISRIRQIKIIVLGKTRNPYIGVNRKSPPLVHLYRRPKVGNVDAASVEDYHRRFLLESSVTIRNLALGLYNTGAR